MWKLICQVSTHILCEIIKQHEFVKVRYRWVKIEIESEDFTNDFIFAFAMAGTINVYETLYRLWPFPWTVWIESFDVRKVWLANLLGANTFGIVSQDIGRLGCVEQWYFFEVWYALHFEEWIQFYNVSLYILSQEM